MHELLIGLLIVTIVAIQIFVFKITLEKIKFFKNILPSQENFKTVKVFIKESEIESVSLVNIFKNLSEFSTKDHEKLKIFNDPNNEEIKEENHEYSKYETVDDSEEFEYVKKDGVQTKIKSKNLDFFISKGWKIINS